MESNYGSSSMMPTGAAPAPTSYSQTTTSTNTYPGGQVTTTETREGYSMQSGGSGAAMATSILAGGASSSSNLAVGSRSFQQTSSGMPIAQYAQTTSYTGPTTTTTTTGGYSSTFGAQGIGATSVTSGGAGMMIGGTYTSSAGGAATYAGGYSSGEVRRVSGATTVATSGPVYTAGARVVGHEIGAGYTTGTRVVGHEYGEQRVISTSQRVDESRQSIISERFVEHEVRVPKKVVREEVIEKVIIVPEKLVHEEVIEEVQKVREKIVEVAKPIIQEKIIEVPEYEYVEKLIEVPERIVQEKVREVAKVEIKERIVEVPKIVTQEKIVEVPDIQYREVPVERVVEVPEIREQVVVKEVPVPQYVDKPIAQYVDVEVPVDVERNIPLAVEAISQFEFSMPRLRPRYTKVTYPVYLPRFIEVPVAQELLSQGLIQAAERYLAQVGVLSGTAASLCEIENLAANIMKADFQSQLQSTDLQATIIKAWQTGMLQFSSRGAAISNNIVTSQQYKSGIMNSGTLQHGITTNNAEVYRASGVVHHKKHHKKHNRL